MIVSIKKILKLHNPIGQDDNVIYEETPDEEGESTDSDDFLPSFLKDKNIQ